MNRPTLLRILTIALAFVMIASACGQAAEPAEPAEPAGAEPAEPAEPGHPPLPHDLPVHLPLLHGDGEQRADHLLPG